MQKLKAKVECQSQMLKLNTKIQCQSPMPKCNAKNQFHFRLPQIYEEFYHTVNNADHEKDLRLWSNTHGVNMAMNWPQFEVCLYCFLLDFTFNKKKITTLKNVITA